jgi:hypothetical protein
MYLVFKNFSPSITMQFLFLAIPLISLLCEHASAKPTEAMMAEINIPIRHGVGRFITQVPVLEAGSKYYLSPIPV